jgi:hypothetical protein
MTLLARISSSRTLKSGILLFWALYFSLVALTNVLDGVKTLGLLPRGWTLASDNYALMAKVTGVHGTSTAVVAVLFLGVIAWEVGAAILFWRGWATRVRGTVYAAFTLGLALWAAMTLADEIFVAYSLGATHLRLFGLQLLSLLALRLLPDE